MYNSQLLLQPQVWLRAACSPDMMTMDWSSEAVRKPRINAFFCELLGPGCLFTAKEYWFRPHLFPFSLELTSSWGWLSLFTPDLENSQGAGLPVSKTRSGQEIRTGWSRIGPSFPQMNMALSKCLCQIDAVPRFSSLTSKIKAKMMYESPELFTLKQVPHSLPSHLPTGSDKEVKRSRGRAS